VLCERIGYGLSISSERVSTLAFMFIASKFSLSENMTPAWLDCFFGKESPRSRGVKRVDRSHDTESRFLGFSASAAVDCVSGFVRRRPCRVPDVWTSGCPKATSN
jgi:hypothetical protein